jgi:hypothetical protein
MEGSLLSLAGIEPILLDRPARSLVAISTEISRLHMGVNGHVMHIKMDLTEMIWEDVNWNELVLDRMKWLDCINAFIDLRSSRDILEELQTQGKY